VPHLRLYPINLPDITFIASRCLVSNRGEEGIAWFLGDGPAERGDFINFKTTNYVDIIFKNPTGKPTQPTSRSEMVPGTQPRGTKNRKGDC